MSNILSAQDILKIAIKVEENGKNLYQALEEKEGDPKIKDLWNYLKREEVEHQKIFQDMLNKVGDYIVSEFSPGEYSAYLKAIASSYIFTQELIEKKIKELFKDSLEAVEFGLYIEKESILTYSAFKEYVLADKQPVLQKVIDEEKKHLTQLFLLREELKKGV
ncbi:MAG TPA: hypothetical protein ENI31_03835 [Candidatus Omnitrophica bacterium]|nr:MAG: hypothetical protein DRP69_02615 [Candidatus Omnitrophota bacterium]RKY43679.1 MAG: hypothetical protein DRP80_04530 [Candidatus Omnitrophota bacterium]HEC69397.1 hypothetical protein [Candidatus Omnitrophota bacterium]